MPLEGEEDKVFPPHEERPGALSDLFKQHLADCKESVVFNVMIHALLIIFGLSDSVLRQ